MEKKFTILIALMFIISAVIPLIIAQEPGDHITVEKIIVDGDLYVPFEDPVSWDLEIGVDTEDDLTNVVVYDGIGAEFDLVLYNSDHTVDADGVVDDPGDYIFKINTVPVTPVSGNIFYGSSGNVYWSQASEKAYQRFLAGKSKGCATVIMWDIGDLDNDDKSLEFTIETKGWWTGNHKHWKQSFTSTCHHTLNDGPIVYYDIDDDHYWIQGDPITVSVYNDQDPEADSDFDGIYDMEEIVDGADGYTTDPCAWDTDGDGFGDGYEVQVGTHPLDPEDYPLPPVAEFTWAGVAAVGIPKTFDASASYDPDGGAIVSYEWDFDNDGEYDDGTGVSPAYTFGTSGWHTVGLKVTDDESDTGTVSHNVKVLMVTPGEI